MPVRSLILVVLAAPVPACISTNVIPVGQKTSLEKQLMGEVEPLTEEELLVASVRAGPGVELGSQDDLSRKAIAARRRQLFNRDDIDELKTAGCLAEGKSARLVARPCDKVSDPEALALRERVVGEENADRQAVIDWAISVDPVLTRADRPQIEALFTELLHEGARPGDLVEESDGSFTKR
ncbi:MAG: hypothetical protein HY903_06715 [Deltaproteobacteria bacterium]|nr:hypothetical protein [Deltaproteobacteria bacterium]